MSSRPSASARRLHAALATFAAVAAMALASADAPARAQVHASVVGGHAAATGEWPWMAGLLLSDEVSPGWSDYQRQFCGGTLIHELWVLTAAHCVRSGSGYLTPSNLDVLLGREDLDGSGGEKIPVTEVVPAPAFDPDTMHDDLALLRLGHAAGERTAAIAAPGTRYDDGHPALVAGWGALSEGGSAPQLLQEADVPLRGDAYCASAYLGFDPASMICAGLPEGGVDTCQGDSGGPLVAQSPPQEGGEWQLLGVTSWGAGCARPNQPGVYAWVAAPHLRLWLTSAMSQPPAATPPPSPSLPGPAAPTPPVARKPDGDTPAPDRVAPTIRRLSLSRTRFRAARHGRDLLARAGTTVRFRLSETARVTIRVERVDGGGRDSLIIPVPGRIEVKSRPGGNRVVFTGCVRGRRLPAGRYRLAVEASDRAGNRSAVVLSRFSVVR